MSRIIASTYSMNVQVVVEADDDTLMLNGGYMGVNIQTHLPVYFSGKSTRPAGSML